VSLKSDNNNGYFKRIPTYILTISRSVLLRMRNVSDKFEEKINTRILCRVTFFFENPAVYEVMWENSKAGEAT
jgi:hypothetical protein